eukprot:319533-Rhodomonas_salina.2
MRCPPLCYGSAGTDARGAVPGAEGHPKAGERAVPPVQLEGAVDGFGRKKRKKKGKERERSWVGKDVEYRQMTREFSWRNDWNEGQKSRV